LGIGDSFAQSVKPIQDICEFASSQKSSLTTLDLSGNGLGAKAVEHLVPMLKSSSCSLQELNLAYNAFDPDDKIMRDLLKKRSGNKNAGAGGSGSDNDSRLASKQFEHPVVRLFNGGLRFNTSLRRLDMTGSFRFGILDPKRSWDPDDRLLDGKSRNRSGLDAEKAIKLGNDVLGELEAALQDNSTLEELWFGEIELEAPAIERLTSALEGSRNVESRGAFSASNAAGNKRKRIIHGARPGDAKRAVANW
jgi:hypothetical protein